MSAIEFNIVIPSRFASSRFPGKPLHPLNGKPMILHVIDRARESAAQTVVVATDDDRIAELCHSYNTSVVMTRVDHVSGTDRIAEVAQSLDWADDVIIVGLQGDEPATSPKLLNRLAHNLITNSDANMASFCVPVDSAEVYANSNRVKVVRDKNNMALYFSRASIPHSRDGGNADTFPVSFVHVGLYAYRCHYLKQFSTTPAAYIEEQEQLEQLRVLYQGGKIHIEEIDEAAAGVDHPDDVALIENILREQFAEGDSTEKSLSEHAGTISGTTGVQAKKETKDRNWNITNTETVYSGFYKLEKLHFQHSLFAGGTSGIVDREQFVRGNVVGVIAHDRKLDKLALVEQFRIGARRNREHPWLIEVIAGMVEPGEEPEDVAIREAYEEAGINLYNVQLATRYLASPGASTEEVFIYYAEADLSTAGGVFGLDEEGEDILLHVIDRTAAFEMAKNGKICNALSIIALQWLQLQST